MTFRCGRCVDVIPTDNLVPGQTVTCARCQHVNVVPEPVNPAPPPSSVLPVLPASALPRHPGPARPRGLILAAAAALVVAAGWGVWSYVEARDGNFWSDAEELK